MLCESLCQQPHGHAVGALPDCSICLWELILAAACRQGLPLTDAEKADFKRRLPHDLTSFMGCRNEATRDSLMAELEPGRSAVSANRPRNQDGDGDVMISQLPPPSPVSARTRHNFASWTRGRSRLGKGPLCPCASEYGLLPPGHRAVFSSRFDVWVCGRRQPWGLE